jgi:hypothetical protein
MTPDLTGINIFLSNGTIIIYAIWKTAEERRRNLF